MSVVCSASGLPCPQTRAIGDPRCCPRLLLGAVGATSCLQLSEQVFRAVFISLQSVQCRRSQVVGERRPFKRRESGEDLSQGSWGWLSSCHSVNFLAADQSLFKWKFYPRSWGTCFVTFGPLCGSFSSVQTFEGRSHVTRCHSPHTAQRGSDKRAGGPHSLPGGN